jgi:hypothetical protein
VAADYEGINLSIVQRCSDPAVHALQFLDVINMKDPGQKSQFYRCTLKEVLPLIPKVSCAQVIPFLAHLGPNKFTSNCVDEYRFYGHFPGIGNAHSPPHGP